MESLGVATELLDGYTSYLDRPYTDPPGLLQTYDVHIPDATEESRAVSEDRKLWIMSVLRPRFLGSGPSRFPLI